MHFRALVKDSGDSVTRPADLQAWITMMHTVDYHLLINRCETRDLNMGDVHLKCEKEEIHVPFWARDAVFVDDGHTDRCEAIC